VLWRSKAPAPLFVSIGAALLLAEAVGILVGPRHTVAWRDDWLFNAASVCGVVSALRSVRQLADGERRARGAIVAGMVLWGLGGAVAELSVYTTSRQPAAPSLDDALYLSSYLFFYAALIMTLRLRVVVRSWPLRLDAVIVGLGIASAYGFLLGPLVRGISGGLAAEITEMAYPVADLLLASFAVAVGARLGWQLDRFLVLFVIGCCLYCIADSHYLIAVSGAGGFHYGTPFDLGWPGALLVWAMAVRQPEPRAARRRPPMLATMLVPVVISLEAIGILLASNVAQVPDPVVALASAALVAVVVRTVLAFREVAGAAEARRLALVDELTGLPNRTDLSQRIAAALSGPSPAAQLLVLLGFERVREITDAFGHAVGDRLVADLSRRLQPAAGPGFLLARFRECEFALFGAGDTTGRGLDDLVARVQRALAAPFPAGGMQILVRPSIGVACFPAHAGDGVELMLCADSALLIARRSDAAYAYYSGGVPDAGRSRLVLTEQLRRAVVDDELTCLYQPTVAIATSQLVGAESLVRWQHPERGLLPPAAFVPLAQEVGLIGSLSRRVLQLVTAQLASWSERGLSCKAAVNLTVTDLLDVQLVLWLEGLLAAHDLEPGQLVVEVTEETFLRDPSEVRASLLGLHDLGIEVSIDDYGSGYSSLSYLRGLPAQELKIDRTFVHGLAADPTARAIVAATVDLAHSLGMRVVAEGVEAADDLAVLGELGCDVAQGYYFAQPLAPAAFETWLTARDVAGEPSRRAG